LNQHHRTVLIVHATGSQGVIKLMNKLFFKTIFAVLLILPLVPPLSSKAENRHDQYLIMVDPAHGGQDKGVKLSGKLYEKDVTLAIAGLIKDELGRSENVKVRLTRSADRDISISDRVKMIKKSGADMFISLHVNAGFGKNSSGFEVYFPGFKLSSTGKSASQEISKDMIKTEYINDSVRFAKIILRNMGKIFPRKDRGLRSAPVPVLDGAAIPAVVLETGFAANVKDRKQLMDRTTQKSIAGAVAQSIREYFDRSPQIRQSD